MIYKQFWKGSDLLKMRDIYRTVQMISVDMWHEMHLYQPMMH